MLICYMHEYCCSQHHVVTTFLRGFLSKLRGSGLFWDNLHSVPDPGQTLKIWDCPGDSETVGAYVIVTDT